MGTGDEHQAGRSRDGATQNARLAGGFIRTGWRARRQRIGVILPARSAEFTAIKGVDVSWRTGWVSDRAAAFLALGRPVVTEDTGAARYLPQESGMFFVGSAAEAAEAAQASAARLDGPVTSRRATAPSRFSIRPKICAKSSGFSRREIGPKKPLGFAIAKAKRDVTRVAVMAELIKADELKNRLKKIPEWELEKKHIERTFEFDEFSEAIDFVNSVAEVAEDEEHHPDIDIRLQQSAPGSFHPQQGWPDRSRFRPGGANRHALGVAEHGAAERGDCRADAGAA